MELHYMAGLPDFARNETDSCLLLGLDVLLMGLSGKIIALSEN